MRSCHVCGNPLTDLGNDKEICRYMHCQVKGVKFNIPYQSDNELRKKPVPDWYSGLRYRARQEKKSTLQVLREMRGEDES